MRMLDFFASWYQDVQTGVPKVYCFTSKQSYPLIFFYFLKKYIVKHVKQPLFSLSLDELSVADIERTLQSSLLGMRMWYWFADLTDLEVKKRDAILSFAASYKGPHSLLFFIQKEDASHHKELLYIEIPEVLTKQEAYQVVENLAIHSSAQKLVDLLYQHGNMQGYSIEDVCKGVWYLLLSGSARSAFIKEQLPLIIEPHTALFGLTSDFFAKKRKPFFAHWNRMQGAYPLPFWTAFWFEQLWRAYFYILCMQKGEYAEAKKIAFRLPFSFINTDWKKYTPEQCLYASQQMYTIDQKTKTGSDGSELDLFFSCFLN